MGRRFTFRRPFDFALRETVATKQRTTTLFTEAYINEASGAIVNADDTVTSTVVNTTVASLVRTEFEDVLTATVTNVTAAQLAVTSTDDTVTATTKNVTAAQGAITEQPDSVATTVIIRVLVTGAITETSDTATSTTTNVTTATAAIDEAGDTLLSTVINTTYATGAITEKADTNKIKGWAEGIDVTGRLDDGAATIATTLLIDLGIGTSATASEAWPVFISSEPEKPDNCITVLDTPGEDQGRYMMGGKRVERKGFQFVVRAKDYETGWLKAHALAVLLDEEIQNTTVTIGATDYNIAAFKRTSQVLHVGRDKPASGREIFTINATASINQVIT